jgi:chromosome segregation ATPase
MTSNNVSGHAANIAAFDELITSLESNNAYYKPSGDQLSITELKDRLNAAKSCLTKVSDVSMEYKTMQQKRNGLFEDARSRIDRLMPAYLACDPSDDQIMVMKNLAKRYKGIRISKKPVSSSGENGTNDNPRIRSHAQTGFIDRIEHIRQMIDFLEKQNNYHTNIDLLQLNKLSAFLLELETVHHETSEKEMQLAKAREERNRLLYQQEDCIYDLFQQIKNNLKAALGKKDPFFSRIAKLKFKKIRPLD